MAAPAAYVAAVRKCKHIRLHQPKLSLSLTILIHLPTNMLMKARQQILLFQLIMNPVIQAITKTRKKAAEEQHCC